MGEINKEEDIFYSDINGIRITSKRFYAGEKSYAIKKIRSINLSRLTPKKRWGIFLFSLGLATILMGSAAVFGVHNFRLFDSIWIIDFDVVSIAIGVVALLVAIIRMMITPDEYTVIVETENGEKEKVISPNSQYAARLTASLKRAYYRQHTKKGGNSEQVLAL